MKIFSVYYKIFLLFLMVFVLGTLVPVFGVKAEEPEMTISQELDACEGGRQLCVKQCEMPRVDCEEACLPSYNDCIKRVLPEGDSLAPSQGAQPPSQGLKGASGRLGQIGRRADVGTKSFEEVVGGIIKGALILVGTIFLILMVYGGYIWMLARGDEAEAKKAKDIISMAIIGIIVVLAAYAITYFIVYRLTQATGAGLQ